MNEKQSSLVTFGSHNGEGIAGQTHLQTLATEPFPQTHEQEFGGDIKTQNDSDT